MTTILTQTFEHDPNRAEELQAIAAALDALGKHDFDAAARILIARHDVLTREPFLKLYGT